MCFSKIHLAMSLLEAGRERQGEVERCRNDVFLPHFRPMFDEITLAETDCTARHSSGGNI